jgi:hypothetical protein
VQETTQLPVWVVIVLTLVPALIAGASAVLAAWLAGARKAARQLDLWRRREESMRMLRWAADKSAAPTDDERLLALSVLDALNRSKPAMLQDEDQGILDAVLEAMLSEPTAAVEEYSDQAGGYEVKVVEDG